jgi:serine O-acetyltransferase
MPSLSILTDFLNDARELAQVARGQREPRQMLDVALSSDSFQILLLQRVREQAKRWHVPVVNHALRRVQTAAYGIELGKDVTIGQGVYFVHPIGVVIGGDARVGNRVKFMGNNTVGTAKDNGYPTIEDDVIVGAGARILGPITVGARSVSGANAVVVTDIPPDSIAVGIPARVQSTKTAVTA